MEYKTRKRVMAKDLNGANALFGGELLKLIDEESGIHATCELDKTSIVTAHMSEINFISPAKLGDILEIGVETVKIGTTSITLKCTVRNLISKKEIITVDKIVFVHVVDGKPTPHEKK